MYTVHVHVPYHFFCMLFGTAVQAYAEEVLHFWETVDREKEFFKTLSLLWTSICLQQFKAIEVIHCFTVTVTVAVTVAAVLYLSTLR